MTSFEIFGHRGTNPYPDHYWGADWAELDIQMTADGVLVVAHDTGTIPRTTYASLHAANPAAMTLDEALDLIAAKAAETGRDVKISIEMKGVSTHAARGLDMPQALVDLLVERSHPHPGMISMAAMQSPGAPGKAGGANLRPEAAAGIPAPFASLEIAALHRQHRPA
ncbi:glycerophosphodiester phosphodiesterase family protein [Teichococcus aestuarii]|uniref:glycerophosphodiester phosphodiesterase family protein n=1 Tax=Teichococcus aestuarii TaxID=568898 RepID=UPI00360F3832